MATNLKNYLGKNENYLNKKKEYSNAYFLKQY